MLCGIKKKKKKLIESNGLTPTAASSSSFALGRHREHAPVVPNIKQDDGVQTGELRHLVVFCASSPSNRQSRRSFDMNLV